MSGWPRTLLASLAFATAFAGAARAEDWAFTVTPYFWASGIKGDLKTLPDLPAAHVDANFSDVKDVLQMGFMAFGEARKGRWGVLGDVTYIDLGLSKHATVRDRAYLAAGMGTKTLDTLLAGAYRVHETDKLALDLYGGVRATWMDTDLTLTLPRGGVREASHKESWVDPVVGGRMIATFSPKWSFTAVGDIGGLGIGSDLAWQLMGTVNYKFSDMVSVSAGYRHYSMDYDKGGFVFDADQSGPIIGTSIRF
jgi:hypothetical protein